MKAVGIKALKARLSEYLRLVKSGETVLVTEREEVVAELRPALHQRTPLQGWAEVLTNLAENGRAVLRSETPKTWEGPSANINISPKTLTEILDGLRRDRE